MKLTSRDIKDKRIERSGLAYVASVHIYKGSPIPAGRHLTLASAQRALAKYPNDVFEGSDDPARCPEHSPVRQTPRAPRPRRKPERDYTRLYDRRII